MLKIIEESQTDGQIRSTRILKALLAAACFVPMLLNGGTGARRDASGELVRLSDKPIITFPQEPKKYGLGMYRIEGMADNGTKIIASLDGKPVKGDDLDNPNSIVASASGEFIVEPDVSAPGKHVLTLKYTVGKKQVTEKIEFTAAKAVNPPINAGEPNPYEAGLKDPDEEVIIYGKSGVQKSGAEPEDEIGGPVNAAAATSTGSSLVPSPGKSAADPLDNEAPIKRGETKVSKVATGKRDYSFRISSVADHNVLPKGIVKIGGYGMPDAKIKVTVDGRLVSKGTVKSDGRWMFPIKINTPGNRRIIASSEGDVDRVVLRLK